MGKKDDSINQDQFKLFINLKENLKDDSLVLDEENSKKEILQNDNDNNVSKEIERRNKVYSEITQEYLNAYSNNQNYKSKMKVAFFSIIMVLMCILTIGCIASIIIVACNNSFNLDFITVCVTSGVTIISSLIAIPLIIAKYLFPLNEDQNLNNMIRAMMVNDNYLRKGLKVNSNKDLINKEVNRKNK